MKAILLAGGLGTRLRPLTYSTPKPLVPFCNTSVVELQIAALTKAGVTDICLAVSNPPELIEAAALDFEKTYGVKIFVSIEQEPLGTAGAIAYAKEFLHPGVGSTHSFFFVCNSDVVCCYPFEEMLSRMKQKPVKGILLITSVGDPSSYGAVVKGEENRIKSFHEKSKDYVSNWINAGIGLYESSVLELLTCEYCNLETSLLPYLAKCGDLYYHKLPGIWADIGTPSGYLTGMQFYLNDFPESHKTLNKEFNFTVGNVIIDSTAVIEDNCIIGPNVCIGKNCKIHEGCKISNSTLFSGVVVGRNSQIRDSIIGWRSRIGENVTVEMNSVIGENMEIQDGSTITATNNN